MNQIWPLTIVSTFLTITSATFIFYKFASDFNAYYAPSSYHIGFTIVFYYMAIHLMAFISWYCWLVSKQLLCALKLEESLKSEATAAEEKSLLTTDFIALEIVEKNVKITSI